EHDELKAQWEAEKSGVQKLGNLREELEAQRTRLESLQRAGELGKAAELKYGVIPKLEQEIKSIEASSGQRRLIKEEVDESDIAKIVSRWTGIPVDKLLEGEVEKL